MLPPGIKSDRIESLDQLTQIWTMNTSVLDLIQRLHTRVAKLESRLTLGHPDHPNEEEEPEDYENQSEPEDTRDQDDPRISRVTSQGMKPVMKKFHDKIEYARITGAAGLKRNITPLWENYNEDRQELRIYPNGGALIILTVRLLPNGETLTLHIDDYDLLSTNNVRKAAACVIRLATGGGWSI